MPRFSSFVIDALIRENQPSLYRGKGSLYRVLIEVCHTASDVSVGE